MLLQKYGGRFLKNGCCRSLSDSVTSRPLTSQSIARSGSSHLTPRSAPVTKKLVTLYSTTESASSAQKPWAKPIGTQSCSNPAAESIVLACCPKLGDPRLRSTTTSKIEPLSTRTSLACAADSI